MPSWTFARGGVCVGGCFLTGDRKPSDAILRHEAVHRVQWLRYGFLMPVLYLFAGRDPTKLVDADARGVVERFAFEAFRRQTPEPAYPVK